MKNTFLAFSPCISEIGSNKHKCSDCCTIKPAETETELWECSSLAHNWAEMSGCTECWSPAQGRSCRCTLSG